MSFKVICDSGRKSLRLIASKVPMRGDRHLDLPRVSSEKSEFGVFMARNMLKGSKSFLLHAGRTFIILVIFVVF